MMQQDKEVEDAPTKQQAEVLAKTYGIKGKSVLSDIDSIQFPTSLPYDFMHLIWENVVPTLVHLWTGDFKGIDEGKEEYQIDPKQWKQIGSETAASAKTIPSSFGPHLPNIADSLSNISADMWSFWVLFIGPVVLQNHFRHPKYFKHFVSLVSLINTCLQRKISQDEIDNLEKGFESWVEGYQKWVFHILSVGETYSLQGSIIKITPNGFLYAPSHSMPSSIFPKVFVAGDLSGVTGHFQWKGMVAMKSSQESPAAAFLTQVWINISCEKPVSTN